MGGGFCDLVKAPHFPVSPLRASQFAVICRDPGTYRCYLSHVNSACEFLGVSSEWARDPSVRRAKEGLEKLNLVYKCPKPAVSAALLLRLANVSQPWVAHRFFVVFCWVFMLRAASEGADLLRASNDIDISDISKPLPGGVKGVVGLVGDFLVVRLASRKNALSGESVKRGCVCLPVCDKLSGYVPVSVCPVHVLWPWIMAVDYFCVRSRRSSLSPRLF